MDSRYEYAIIASDALSEILIKSDLGKNISKKIASGKFGKRVFATNVTLSSVLKDLTRDKTAVQQSKEIIFHFMPEDENKSRSFAIDTIPVTEKAWNQAWVWYVDSRFRKVTLRDTPIDMDILNWCDIAMIPEDKRLRRIITSIPYYEIISDITKKIKKLDKDRIWDFPRFDVVS